MAQSKIVSPNEVPRLQLRVPLDPSRLLRARDRVRDYLRQYCADSSLIDDVVLCIEEACTNVIRHSGSDEDIEMSLRFADADLIGVVRDHGQGFDTGAFDPAALPDVHAAGGRGLYLIAHLTDEMTLCSDGGLEVRMVKKAVTRRAAVRIESGFGELQAADSDHRDSRLRALLEEIDEAFLALDWEYRYVHANAAALRLMCLPSDELLGRRPWEAFPEMVGTPLDRAYREAMELGRPSILEHRSIITDDWLEVRIYPTPAGVSAYYREINERKRTEDALRESEQRYRALFENALVGIFETAPDGSLLAANQALATIFGYETAPQMLAVVKNVAEDLYFDPRDRKRILRSAGERQDGAREALRVKRRDGSAAWIVLTMRVVRTDDGLVVRYEGTVFDITEHKRLEEALRAATQP